MEMIVYNLAIYSDRLDCYQQLPENKKKKKKIKRKPYLKRYLITIHQTLQWQSTGLKSYDKVEYLKELFREEKYKEIEKVIESIKKTKTTTATYNYC